MKRTNALLVSLAIGAIAVVGAMAGMQAAGVRTQRDGQAVSAAASATVLPGKAPLPAVRLPSAAHPRWSSERLLTFTTRSWQSVASIARAPRRTHAALVRYGAAVSTPSALSTHPRPAGGGIITSSRTRATKRAVRNATPRRVRQKSGSTTTHARPSSPKRPPITTQAPASPDEVEPRVSAPAAQKQADTQAPKSPGSPSQTPTAGKPAGDTQDSGAPSTREANDNADSPSGAHTDGENESHSSDAQDSSTRDASTHETTSDGHADAHDG
jgi:hypothetical protein